MAFSPNLAAVCAAMALKALACTMISGTLEALTYDSLKTAGRENEYLQADAKISVLQKLPQRWGRWQVYSPTCCNLPGFTWPMQPICFCSLLAALTLQEPLVTEAQAARQQNPFADIAARLRVHITDSAAVLRTTPLAVRLITADAIISLPSYLTTMFVQQRLVTLGWGASWLFVSPLLASAAAMVCTALARRLHPGKLRPLIPTVCPSSRRWCAVGRGPAGPGLRWGRCWCRHR